MTGESFADAFLSLLFLGGTVGTIRSGIDLASTGCFPDFLQNEAQGILFRDAILSLYRNSVHLFVTASLAVKLAHYLPLGMNKPVDAGLGVRVLS